MRLTSETDDLLFVDIILETSRFHFTGYGYFIVKLFESHRCEEFVADLYRFE